MALRAWDVAHCTLQPDNACVPVGELTWKGRAESVAYDRDGRYFFAADQLLAADRAQPLLHVHIYDLELDTVETELAQDLPHKGFPELYAVDKEDQGWQLFIKQSDCKMVGKQMTCVDYYGIQRPGQSRPEPLQILYDKNAHINCKVDCGH